MKLLKHYAFLLLGLGRLVMSCFFSFVFLSVAAQSTPTVKDPLDVVQPSPTSQSLGQFGGVNVGVASGTINKRIDLYDFVSGALNVNLSLAYSSNGIKVTDNGGIVGTGWTATLGGVITRTVMGEQDEQTSRLPVSFNPYGGNMQTLNYLKGMVSYDINASTYDGEPDIFSFNFAGYSGKFILDANGTPVLLNHSGLQIRKIDWNTFSITTPDGIRYDFGGLGALETISKNGMNCGKIFHDTHNSAFFLRKITHPKGDVINFVYSNNLQYAYPTGIQETLTYTNVIECSNGQAPHVTEKECLNSLITNTVLLEEINGSVGKIIFNYKTHLAGNDRLLDGFEVYKTGETAAFRKIKLNYLTHQASSNYRQNTLLATTSYLQYWNFLSNVQELDANGLKVRQHTFSYLNLSRLPRRFANCQDYYGYFNGQNNWTLIPLPESEEWRMLFPTATANREPNANFVSTGLLSKIVYPTGGSDSLVYEANTSWSMIRTPAPPVNASLSVAGRSPNQEGIILSNSFSVANAQSMTITLRCDILAEDGVYPGSGIVELLENGVVKNSLNAQAYNINSSIVYLSTGKTYQIRLRAIRGPLVSCTATYAYASGAPTITYENKIAAGVRIAKVITANENGTYQKEYKYYSISDPDMKSTGEFISVPTYGQMTTSRFSCVNAAPGGPDEPGAPDDCAMSGLSASILLSSNSRFNNIYFSGAPVYYREVFEEDNFTKGGIAYKFNIFANISANVIQGENMNAPLTTNDDLNGLEIFRRYFKRSGTALVPVKDIVTSFKIDTRVNNTYKAFVSHERFIVNCISSTNPTDLEFEAFNLLQYNHYQRWIYTDSIKTRTYDAQGATYSESLQLFYYDNPTHAQLSRSTILGSDNVALIHQTLYPSDYANGVTFINDMKSNLLLGLPIEQVTYRQSGTNVNILTGFLTTYQTGGKGLLETVRKLETQSPINSSSFKFSNRVLGVVPPAGTATSFSVDSRYTMLYQINLRDLFGNPLEGRYQDGSTIVFLWGYNGQYPVAKIENATYTEIQAVLTPTEINNLNAASVSEETVRNTIAKLRNHLNMRKAQVSTYTYKPLVGMTSMTDPRGITEFYQYDGFQRLKDVLDFDSNVLQDYRYNYRP